MRPGVAIDTSRPIDLVSRIPLLALIDRNSSLGDVPIYRQLDLYAQQMMTLDRYGGARNGEKSTVAT